MLTPLLPPLSATPRPHGHSLASCYSRGKNPNKVPESATGRFPPSTPTPPPALPRLRGAAAASFLPASQEGGARPTAGPLLMLPALLPQLSPSPRASRVAATPHVGASRGPARLPDQVPSSCYRSLVQPVLPLPSGAFTRGDCSLHRQLSSVPHSKLHKGRDPVGLFRVEHSVQLSA